MPVGGPAAGAGVPLRRHPPHRARAVVTTTTTDPATVPSSDPAPTNAVGVVHLRVTDPTRSTPPRGETPGSDVRSIDVTVRSPTYGDPGSPENEGAAAQAGTFPLVVFAHGFDASAETYATLEHQLAVAGFVVAAPDFSMTSSAIAGPADEGDVVNQAADVSFVVSTLFDPDRVPTVLAGAIGEGPVGVVGHSDGGVTAAGVAYDSEVADARIGAAVVLSGAIDRFPGSWFTTASPPLLAVHGSDDQVNPFGSSQVLYDAAWGPRLLVAVEGGSHLGPFTDEPAEPDVAALVAAFLHTYLQVDAGVGTTLDALANVSGELALIAEG